MSEAIEYRILHRDGKVRHVREIGLSILEEEGKSLESFATLLDITVFKQIEDSLRESEESLADATRIAHLGSWVWNIEDNSEVWSDEQFRIFGYQPGEIEPGYTHFLDALHPEDQEKVNVAIKAALDDDVPYDIDFRIVRPDKSERVIHALGQVYRDSKNKPERMIGTVLDITERKLAEMELKASESQLRLITDNIPAMIALVDTKKHYLYANEKYSSFFNRSAKNIVGRHVRDVISAHAFKIAFPYIKKALQGQTVEFEVEIPQPDDTPKYLSVIYVPHFDDAVIDGFLVLLFDITHNKRMEEQLRHAQKMVSLGNLSAGIAHELNQPLGAVLLNSQMMAKLVDRGDLEKIRTVSESIVAQMLRAKTIVDALRTFSRQDMTVERSLNDVNKIVREVAILYADELKLGQVDLDLVLTKDEIVTIISSVQMGQILSNLISNAKDAVEHQAVKRIRISTRLSKENIIVEVSDTGLGIAQSIMGKIFDPFFTTKAVGKGTGLGLSLSYSMVKDNGGNITVRSKVGEGTKFVITLPVKGVSGAEKSYLAG